MTPDEFRKEYIEPAVELWCHHHLVTHLAANAIAQIDALADVVWIAQGSRGRVSTYRDDLGMREPAISMIRDACDSHKHGRLRREQTAHISGERPKLAEREGVYARYSIIGGVPISYTVLVIRKRDGSEQEVRHLIFDAMLAWRREFGWLGYDQNWLIMGDQY